MQGNPPVTGNGVPLAFELLHFRSISIRDIEVTPIQMKQPFGLEPADTWRESRQGQVFPGSGPIPKGCNSTYPVCRTEQDGL